MTSREQWIAGARPKTLPAAIAPVIVGTAFAGYNAQLTNFLLALIVGVALQVGVNYANDYSDGIKGTDNDRIGPMRLVGSGAASPESVKRAAYLSFSLAAVAGLILSARTNWLLILIGALAIIAAWTYTGGRKPYGYFALGEVAVFIFFGLVATIGTDYIQVLDLNILSIFAGCMAGCFATAVLLINNIRDIDTDKASNKKTLAARIGRKPALVIFALLLLAPFVLLTPFWLVAPATFIVNLLLIPVVIIILIATSAKTPKELILALQLTSYTSLLFAIGFTWGLVNVTF